MQAVRILVIAEVMRVKRDRNGGPDKTVKTNKPDIPSSSMNDIARDGGISPTHDYDMDTSGALELAAGIVRQAADDYEKALRGLLRRPGDAEKRKLLSITTECEGFFRSPWFDALVTSVDGEAIIKQVQENAVRKERERAAARLKKAKEQMGKKMMKGG